MTTIAYKKGVIAIDSRISAENTIRYDDYEKWRIVEGHVFFLCGEVSSWDQMIEAYFGRAKPTHDLDCSTIFYDGSNFWIGAYRVDCGFWKEIIPYDSCMAIGSGTDHALTAMDLGQSASEAVAAASRRDLRTGGILRTFTSYGTTGLVVTSQGPLA